MKSGIVINIGLSISLFLILGLTRLERLKRAENFGLSPPEKVRELVEKNINDERYTQW